MSGVCGGSEAPWYMGCMWGLEGSVVREGVWGALSFRGTWGVCVGGEGGLWAPGHGRWGGLSFWARRIGL